MRKAPEAVWPSSSWALRTKPTDHVQPQSPESSRCRPLRARSARSMGQSGWPRSEGATASERRKAAAAGCQGSYGANRRKVRGEKEITQRAQAAWRGAVEHPSGGPSAPWRRCWRLGRKRPSPSSNSGPTPDRCAPTRIWFWRAMKFKVLLRKRGGARARAADREFFLEIRPFGGSCSIYHAS